MTSLVQLKQQTDTYGFWLRVVLLLWICLTMVGCFPYHYTICPGLYGRVVSAKNNEPLAGVAVSLELSGVPVSSVGQTNNTTVAFSGNDGYFVVQPERKWGIWIIPQDVFPLPWVVGFRQTGFETNSIKFGFSSSETGKRSTEQLGVISLKPLPKSF